MSHASSEFTFLRDMFDEAVRVADPMRAIPQYLPPRPSGNVIVIGAGKASARMAEAVEAAWGPCEGLVITRYGYGRPTQGIKIVEAAHPVADQAGMDATQEMLDLISDLGPDDLVLALISGGGSALLCAPSAPLTLAHKQDIHQVLLSSGAPVGQMNTIRKHLSKVKGGQLAAAAYPAQVLALMISDVPGDNPADIASGVTVGETSTAQDALDIVRAHGIQLPEKAHGLLLQRAAGNILQGIVNPDNPKLSTTTNEIISAPSQSIAAAKAIALKAGYEVYVLGDDLEGEAAELGEAHAKRALYMQETMMTPHLGVVLLSGGECTVTGAIHDSGAIGGPNSEYALAAAKTLQGADNIFLIACDTDGVDGAAEFAGALVGPDTLKRAKALGLDAQDALDRHDSHSFFEQIDQHVVTGPTLTNVNDFRAILILPNDES